jgi:hypothetical protein
MASLTAHLRRPDDHGGLAFHPECPICSRERLTGAPPPDVIVGPRNRALLAAGVLALSTASPTTALASDPDQEKEGTAAPEQVADSQAQPDPAFDPGGQSTELPIDIVPPPETGAAPLEPEPATDEIAPVPDASEGTGNQIAEQQPQPAAPEPLPQPPAPEPVAAEPPPTPPAEEAPVVTQHEPQVRSVAPAKATEELAPASEPNHAEAPAPVPAPPQPDPVGVAEVATGSATARVAQSATAPRQRARRSDRFHVVQRGESLWSIARDLLGDDVSVARIAYEVNRLWELNSGRIGTGKPDLLLIGTRIAIR